MRPLSCISLGCWLLATHKQPGAAYVPELLSGAEKTRCLRRDERDSPELLGHKHVMAQIPAVESKVKPCAGIASWQVTAVQLWGTRNDGQMLTGDPHDPPTPVLIHHSIPCLAHLGRQVSPKI